MHRVNVTLYAAALTVLISGLWWGSSALPAKEPPGPSGIPPEKVAAYVYAVIKADRTLYTTEIVNRLQAKGVTTASEHWEQENALMLPAQFLENSVGGCRVAERRTAIEFPIAVWTVAVDVVEEQLRGLDARERVAPVSHFGAPIEHAVARLEFHCLRCPLLLDPKRPRRLHTRNR